jgi:hypothetical protein
MRPTQESLVNGRLAAALIVVAGLTGCAGRSWVGFHPLAPSQPHEAITFWVFSGDQPHENVVGGAVFGIGASGLRELGSTNSDGEFHVTKAFLRAEKLSALIFCWTRRQPVPCSAVRLDDPQILDFDELNVELPLLKAIDRFRLGAKSCSRR